MWTCHTHTDHKMQTDTSKLKTEALKPYCTPLKACWKAKIGSSLSLGLLQVWPARRNNVWGTGSQNTPWYFWAEKQQQQVSFCGKKCHMQMMMLTRTHISPQRNTSANTSTDMHKQLYMHFDSVSGSVTSVCLSVTPTHLPFVCNHQHKTPWEQEREIW